MNVEKIVYTLTNNYFAFVNEHFPVGKIAKKQSEAVRFLLIRLEFTSKF